ncbi:TPA: fimbrial protein [Serratia fonticola]
MVKHSLIALALATIVGSAVAAPVANLKINGDIRPPTCTVNGGDQADLIYNLGAVSPLAIPKSSGYNGLPSVANTLTVDCDAATYLTFKAQDQYQNTYIQMPGTDENYKGFVFNLVDTNSPDRTVGGVSYAWSDVTADGEAVFISRANDGRNDTGTYAWQALMVQDATNGWTKTSQRFVDPSSLDLVSAKQFSAILKTNTAVFSNLSGTYLLSKDELTKQGVDISNGVDYTSNVTLTFNFGV